jgi:hypothetical protein
MIRFEFSIHDESGNIYIVALNELPEHNRVEFRSYGSESKFLKAFVLSDFLMLRAGVLLQSNTKTTDYRLGLDDVEYCQVAISKFLTNHAQFNEA